MEKAVPQARGLKRWQAIGLGVLAAIVVFVLVFDWNWFRKPLQTYISDKTHREFRIGHLDVDLGLTPTIKLQDVYFANAEWSRSSAPMASIGNLEFQVSLKDLLDKKVYVPRVALSNADFLFEKLADARRNWVLGEPSETDKPSAFRIGSLSVDSGRLRFLHHGEPLSVEILASTFESTATQKVTDADAKAQNTSYTTRYAFKGRYHDAAFSGEALTGDVLSFQETGIPFPLKGKLLAGTTRAEVEGTIADVTDITAIDVQLHIAGDTLASLYPFLLLPLPASPAYDFRGHLVQKGERYAIDDLRGKIGSTDVSGRGAYVQREPRPLLTASLNSKLLKIEDLGPIIGLETKDTASAPTGTGTTARPTQADTNTRETAKAKEQQTGGDRILPTGTTAAKGDGILPKGKFEGGRLRAIDAEVDYAAASLEAPSALPVENMKFSFRLNDGVAKLVPLEFGFAGGRIVGDITLDARQPTLASVVNVDFRGIQVGKLFPTMPKAVQGVGEIGAQVRLKGKGNSIADAAANATGTLDAAMDQGRISNLLDAIAGLNGGKVISLLISGDKEIGINCGGVSFDVQDGIGRSDLFVIDTEQTRIDGTGTFSLKDEKFDVTVSPKPKKPGILSLRTPVHLYGTFRDPDFGLDKGKLMLRAGATAALAAINPLAALVPLLEPGSGKDTDCGAVLANVKGAQLQAKAPPNSKAPVSATPTVAAAAAPATKR